MKKIIISVTVVILVGVAILLIAPAINVHTMPPIVHDVNNLRQISLACEMFSRDNGGKYPDDWRQLEPYVLGVTKLFVMPKNRRNAGSMTNVMEWTDYVYLPGVTTSSPAHRVVAFLPPGHYDKTNSAVILFADGHVERQTQADFTRTMNKNPNQAPEDTARKLADPQR